MKRETTTSTLVLITLNTLWSLTFDFLPNLVDFSALGIKPFSPTFYLIILAGFILINSLAVFYMRRRWKRQAKIQEIDAILNHLMSTQAVDLTDKPLQMIPGEYRPVLQYYSNAIDQLYKLNGSVEFGLEGIPQEFDESQPILLYEVMPGMSQHFMVISQGNNIDDILHSHIRIFPDFGSDYKEFADQEFTDTWFNKILPIVSSFSENISKRREGPGFDMRTHHAITNFKIIKRGKGYFFRIKVI